MEDNLSHFIRILQRPNTPRRNLIDASSLLANDVTSEFGRVLRSLGVDIVGALSATPREWQQDTKNLDSDIAVRCAAFLSETGAPDMSSATLAHVLFRDHPAAFSQAYLAVGGFQSLPPLVTRKATVRATVRLTRASVLSWSLGPDGPADCRPLVPTMNDFDGLLKSPIGERLFERARSLTTKPGANGPLSSKLVLRAGLALGGDQRTANWMRSASVHPIAFVRDEVNESVSETYRDVPLTDAAIAVLGVAQRLAAMSEQQVDADRLILASLVTSGSYVETLLRSVFGLGVNLPLLYLLSARPGALSEAECRLLVAAGDQLSKPHSTPTTGDVPVERFENLRLEALTVTPAFEARKRLEAFGSAAGELPTSFYPMGDLQRRGILTGGLRYFALAALRSGDVGALSGTRLKRTIAEATSALRPDDEAMASGATLLEELCSEDATRRSSARSHLFVIQSDEVSLDLLARMQPTLSEECVEAAADGDASRVKILVRAELALAAGAQGPKFPVPERSTSLCIGAGPRDYALALVSERAKITWTTSFAARELLSEWSDIRRATLSNNTAALRVELTRHAVRLGLDRIAAHMEDQDVDLFVVSPFDALYLDLAIKTIARPRSIVYRVFGGGPGSWQRSLSMLARSGGRRVFIADPTASLDSARLEAVWLASETEGELVTGVDADRARILRSLEAAPLPAQLLHFTGHGVSDLVDPSGRVVSGVRVGLNEVVTASMLADSLAPRVLIASACDVACLPPLPRSRGWHTAALHAGVGYSVAASIPVSDPGALAFSLMLYQAWDQIDDLESAMAETTALGRDPKTLVSRLEAVRSDEARIACLDWIAASSADDIDLLFSSFCSASI